ncbi:MAG: hypothetical protein ACI9I4_000814, partial [Neolewinella sp.]
FHKVALEGFGIDRYFLSSDKFAFMLPLRCAYAPRLFIARQILDYSYS